MIEQYIRNNGGHRSRVLGHTARRVAVSALARPDILHSVHSIQGREADVVIASLVRSGGHGKGAHDRLGHVADPALVNVLFSRPRLLLVAVGDLSFFESCAELFPVEAGFWGDVCRAVRRNARIVPVEDFYYNV